jgi:pimeloyl-ACP methyl ester carboxylesterase
MSSTTGFFNGLYYEIGGDGHPLVLIHGGLVDSGLWDDQFDVFADRYRVLRYDARGYGQSAVPDQPYSNHDDLRQLLDTLSIDAACVLGLSMGGSMAIDFTLAYPDRVSALIAVGPGISGNPPSDTLRQQSASINEAYERGDKALAVELSLRLWTDGPRRSPDQVNPRAREHIRRMTAHMFDLPDYDNSWLKPLEPPASQRLAEIRVPTLLVVGAEDMPYMHATIDRLAAEIVGAKKVVILDAAHHPNAEQPDEFNRMVLEFLDSLSR